MTTVCSNCEPDALSINTRVILVCAFFLMFCTCFAACWFIMERHYNAFKALAFNVKADNCSRVNSTIHSIVIVPCLIIGLWTTEWGPDKQAVSSVAFLQVILCFVCAYFLCDTLVMIMYRVPLWGVYLAHHILAVTPYIIYLFISPCGYGIFLLSAFMLVEFSNFTLNSQAWMEQNGTANGKLYAFCFYGTFFGWIACRLVNPYVMVYYAHAAIYPSIPEGNKWCFIPALCCGYLIVLFCTSVFIFVLCAALKKRWASTSSWSEIAQHDGAAAGADAAATDASGNANNSSSGRIDRPMLADGEDAVEKARLSAKGHAAVPVGGDDDYEGMESPTKAIGTSAAKAFDALATAARERANSIGLGGSRRNSAREVEDTQ